MENFETVYVLTNKEMPGICKIGYTSKNDINERTKKLYTTGVPHPFDVYCVFKVKDGKKLESIVHKIYDKSRIRPDREFFRIDPEHVKQTISLVKPDDFIDNQIQDIVVKEKRKRLHNFTFSELDIPIGSVLNFSRNNDITCIVYSDNTVIYNQKIITLTEATRFTGLVNFKEIQGPRFWTYENETLTKRRKRILKLQNK